MGFKFEKKGENEMQSYYIPRNYKGEGRILYIFSTKAIIYTAVGAGIGLIFYFMLNLIGLTTIGIIITALFGGIGFAIATFKVPEMKNFEITKKTGGENIDEVIKRWFLFKKKKNRVYVYKELRSGVINEKKEDTKDE